MLGVSKAEKLAAARKKLKEFQQRQKGSHVTSVNSFHTSYDSCSKETEGISFVNNNFISHGSLSDTEFERNGSKHTSTTPIFSFQNNSSGNENFFDNLRPTPAFRVEDVVGGSLPVSRNVFFDNNVLNNEELRHDSEQGIIPSSKSSITESSSSSSKSEDECSKRQMTDLDNLINIERRSNDELKRKLTESNEHVVSLQNEIKRLHEETDTKVLSELSSHEKKMKLQEQTIEILVSEKSELQKELLILQEENKAFNDRCEELAGRLKASRSQVQKLEKELFERSESKAQYNDILKKLEDELRMKEVSLLELNKEYSDAKSLIKELEKKIQMSNQEQEGNKRLMEEKEKELSMARIRLTQLGKEGNEEQLVEMEKLKEDLESRNRDVMAARKERLKIESELKEYISSLGDQLEAANQRCEEIENAKEELARREESLVKHLSDLEKQLQKERQMRESHKEEILSSRESNFDTSLNQSLMELQKELIEKKKELAQALEALSQADERLLVAEKKIDEVPDMKLLQAAMESDRIAASRAVQQNNSLKERLHELEEYIIKMNNNKLELTEELDKYRHEAAELRLQMEKFKSRQEMRMVDSVTQTILIRRSDFNSQTTYEDIASYVKDHEHVSVDAMIMLEEKLKRTMDRVADLSDEKQRLEHLVLQLQSETETIGEYVTLYQNQRSLLQERAKERERQIALIAKEREELKMKLEQINSLLSQNSQGEETASKISTLVNEIQCSSLVQERLEPPPSFHPCLVCSGKLINV